MKNIVSIIFLSLFVSAGAMAQNYGFGVKAGVNGSDFRTGNDNFEMKLGYLLGIYANLRLSERVGFQPELVYSNQGAATNDIDVNLNYLNIPMMFKLYVTPAVNLQLGPYIGFIVDKRLTSDLDNLDKDDIEDSFKGLDVGLAGGINFEAAGGFNVGVRYAYGFSDVNKGYDQTVGGSAISFDSDASNSIIEFALGFTF